MKKKTFLKLSKVTNYNVFNLVKRTQKK